MKRYGSACFVLFGLLGRAGNSLLVAAPPRVLRVGVLVQRICMPRSRGMIAEATHQPNGSHKLAGRGHNASFSHDYGWLLEIPFGEVHVQDTDVNGAILIGMRPSGNVCPFPKNVGFSFNTVRTGRSVGL